MRGEQLARQWRILRTLESGKTGATVADLAQEQDCHPRTVWRDLTAIQEASFHLYFKKRWPGKPLELCGRLQVSPAGAVHRHNSEVQFLRWPRGHAGRFGPSFMWQWISAILIASSLTPFRATLWKSAVC